MMLQKNNRQAARVFTGIVLGCVLFLLLDSFGNPEKSFKFTGINSSSVIIPAVLLLFGLRVKFFEIATPLFKKICLMGTVFFTAISAVTLFFTYITPANTLFALTRITSAPLLLTAIFLAHVTLLVQKNSWWQKQWPRVLFAYPFFFFMYASLARFLPLNIFLDLVKEDHLIEYWQSFVLLLGAVVSSLTVLYFVRSPHQKKNLWLVFFLLCALGFFFIAGDEIAWGQRFFRIQPTEIVKEVNRQQEWTVHNLYSVEWFVAYGYALISLFGISTVWIAHRRKFLTRFKALSPSPLLFGYFIFPFGFYVAQLLVKNGIWHAWSEPMELLLYSGIVLWVCQLRLVAQKPV